MVHAIWLVGRGGGNKEKMQKWKESKNKIVLGDLRWSGLAWLARKMAVRAFARSQPSLPGLTMWHELSTRPNSQQPPSPVVTASRLWATEPELVFLRACFPIISLESPNGLTSAELQAQGLQIIHFPNDSMHQTGTGSWAFKCPKHIQFLKSTSPTITSIGLKPESVTSSTDAPSCSIPVPLDDKDTQGWTCGCTWTLW